MPSSALGSWVCKQRLLLFVGERAVPEYVGALGRHGAPSRKRFSLYSKLIFSSETGQWLMAAARAARRTTASAKRCARERWRDR